MRGKRPPRTIENDLRLIASYSRRLDPIVSRITNDEIAGLSDEDLYFLLGFTERLGIGLSNLATSIRHESRWREPDPTRVTIGGNGD